MILYILAGSFLLLTFGRSEALIEGDLILPEDDENDIRRDFRDTMIKWTDNTIPYKLDPYFDTDAVSKGKLLKAMQAWSNHTCLSFPEASGSEPNYVMVKHPESGCNAVLGMYAVGAGAQNLNLGSGCLGYRVMLHELAHTIGFIHEQYRPDRDTYVTVDFSNVAEEDVYHYLPWEVGQVDSLGVPYDYASIVHYTRDSYLMPPMTTKDPLYRNLIGTFYYPSFLDFKAANIKYGCADKCGDKTCPGQGFLDKNCVCQCPGWPVKKCDSNEPDGPGFECDDYEEKCGVWKEGGWCEKWWEDYTMTMYCKKTCGVCDWFKDIPPACYDLDDDCETFAASGQCGTDITKANTCQRSCKLCSY